MAVKKTAKQPQAVSPEQPAKIAIEFTQQDWQDLITLAQVGGQKSIDNIIAKVESLSQTIKQQLPQP